MRSPRRAFQFVAVAGFAAAMTAAPAVLAQTGPDEEAWGGSAFGSPFAGSAATVAESSFPIAGSFVKTDRQLGEDIVAVQVSFGPAGSDTDAVSESVETGAGTCLPAPIEFLEGGSTTDETARFDFTVPAGHSTWPCNGTYVVTAEAQSDREFGPYEMTATLKVAVPPAPVTEVTASADAGAGTVAVGWTPLPADSPQLVGYRVERAGPGEGDGFEAVGDVLPPDADGIVDEPTDGGAYRYRVRALREGPDGPVPSPAEGSGVAEATLPVEEAPTTTTEPSIDRPDRPRSNGGRSAPVAPGRGGNTTRLTTPTTVDTGFEETLGYDDREPGGDSPELAGRSGQSIIRTEGEGAGLLAPAAGAMVLLGWAGHIVYLNRLAKQF